MSENEKDSRKIGFCERERQIGGNHCDHSVHAALQLLDLCGRTIFSVTTAKKSEYG